MKRPLVDSGPVSEFGETDASFVADDRSLDFSEDMMYVPGFSDLRRQRDIELGQYNAGTLKGEDVSHLPCNVYWTRCSSLNGNVDAKKLMGAKNAGYRPVTQGDVGSKWLTQMGSGWQVRPDGGIINAAGDYQLMVLEGRAAAHRAKSKEKRWLDASGAVEKADKQDGPVGGQEIKAKDGKSIVDKVKQALVNTMS